MAVSPNSRTAPITKKLARGIKAAAKRKFVPWSGDPELFKPPTNPEWTELANPHLANLRVAWKILYKTKPEVIEFVEQITNEGAGTYLQSFSRTTRFFESVSMMMAAADARMLCAGAASINGKLQ